MQQAAWSATPTSGNSEIHIEYLSANKEKIAEKRKFRKMWQINRCPVLKNKLNRAIKTLKNLLFITEIREYLSKLSATSDYSFFGKLPKT